MSDKASLQTQGEIEIRLQRLGMSETAIVDGWGTPYPWLDGGVPADALARGERLTLIRTARGMFQLEGAEWAQLGEALDEALDEATGNTPGEDAAGRLAADR